METIYHFLVLAFGLIMFFMKVKNVKEERMARPRLNTPETAKVLMTIENPAAKFRFETTKKGGLNVRLTEIEK